MNTVYVCFNTDQGCVEKVTSNRLDMLKWIEEKFIKPYDESNGYDSRLDFQFGIGQSDYYDVSSFDTTKGYLSEMWSLHIEESEYQSVDAQKLQLKVDILMDYSKSWEETCDYEECDYWWIEHPDCIDTRDNPSRVDCEDCAAHMCIPHAKLSDWVVSKDDKNSGFCKSCNVRMVRNSKQKAYQLDTSIPIQTL